jgi:hypothetical protein
MKLQNLILVVFVIFLATNITCCAFCTDPPPQQWRSLPLQYCEAGPYYERCFYGWHNGNSCVVSQETNGVCSPWQEERCRFYW